MPIDLQSGDLIPIEAVPDLPIYRALPRRPNVRTVWRWVLRGTHRIRLDTVLVANRRFTTGEAVHEFHRAVTKAADLGREAPSRAVEADAKLRGFGI